LMVIKSLETHDVHNPDTTKKGKKKKKEDGLTEQSQGHGPRNTRLPIKKGVGGGKCPQIHKQEAPSKKGGEGGLLRKRRKNGCAV